MIDFLYDLLYGFKENHPILYEAIQWFTLVLATINLVLGIIVIFR